MDGATATAADATDDAKSTAKHPDAARFHATAELGISALHAQL